MRRTRRTRTHKLAGALLPVLALLAAGGTACSLINAFDAVVPADGGAAGSTTGVGGSKATTTTTSSGGGASTTTTSTHSSSTGGASTTSSSSSSGGAGGTGGMDAGPLPGVIAVGAAVVIDGGLAARVLATLDPTTGLEWQRYPIRVVAIAYDGLTDLWYVFEASHDPPFVGSPLTVHTGTIDPRTGVWTETSMVTGLPTLADVSSGGSIIGVLNQRLVYRAYDPTYDGGGQPPAGIEVLDTSDPVHVAPASFGGFLPLTPSSGTAAFLGVLASPGGNAGGTMTVLEKDCGTADAGAGCQLTRLSANVGPNAGQTPNFSPPTAAATIDTPPLGYSVGWASQQGSPHEIIMYPEPGEASVTVRRFLPGSAAISPISRPRSPGAERIFGVAFAECQQVFVADEYATMALYAIPADPTGTPLQVGLGAYAAEVVFEPVTSTALIPSPLPGYFLNAFTLGGTSKVPTLTQRVGAQWKPPADLQVHTLAVRNPLPIACPP